MVQVASLQILSVNTQVGQVVHMCFQPTILQKMHDHHPNLGWSHHSNQIKSKKKKKMLILLSCFIWYFGKNIEFGNKEWIFLITLSVKPSPKSLLFWWFFFFKIPTKKAFIWFLKLPTPKNSFFDEILYQKIKLCVWLRTDSFLISKSLPNFKGKSFQIIISQEHCR